MLKTERLNTIGESDLELVLPDYGEMNGLFWAWDRHARTSSSWPQLEMFATSPRDIELAESLGTTGEGARPSFV